MIGLADCNNFFVSCERSVDSSLEGKAVVVMSNNDGCIVARSNEAKAMGIKMGQPVFEVKDLVNSGKLIAISGHHLLYRDISFQIHDIFRRYVPSTIDYSVDEAFLDMSGISPENIEEIAIEICETCLREMRIPVTIGISLSKTLAKVMTESCKKRGQKVGILTDQREIDILLNNLSIRDLWGIGRRLAKRLYQYGVFTVGDFAQKDRNWVKANFGVNLEKSWLELHGTNCIELNHVGRNIQDSISETRTFPTDINDFDYLRARIAIYAADCAKKLRKMNAVCHSVSTFLRTNRFHTKNGVHYPEITIRLASPSDRTSIIAESAIIGLSRIYSRDLSYKRAGVILYDIKPKLAVMGSLFESYDNQQNEKPNKMIPSLVKVLDSLNSDISHPLIRLASQLTKGHPGHNDGYSSSFQYPGMPSDIID